MARAAWESEFAQYFSARATALRRLAFPLCGDWHTAEDLVQVTFIKIYRRWNGIRPESVDAYVRQTLVNSFRSHRRGRLRESLTSDLPDSPSTPAGTDSGDRIDLGRALASLPPRQRVMIVLRYLEDMSVADVADVLGIAEGTVKSQTARGVASLRRVLRTPALTKEDR